jgi:type I restriction enzyme, S subunit
MMGTAGQLRVPTSYLKKAIIPLPPLPEQHRIVARIEELFSRLDVGVEALQRAKAQLQRYRQAVLKAAVEGRLTEEWRKMHPEVEPAEKLLERILREKQSKWEEKELAKMLSKHFQPKNDRWKQKYRDPKLLAERDLPDLPAGWDYTLLDPILSIGRTGMKTGPFGSLLKKEEHKTAGIPVLGIENIDHMKFVPGSKIHISEEKANQLSDYDAKPGDVIVSRSGTVGEVCVVPEDIGSAMISTNLMRITLNSKALFPKFFCLLLNGSPFVMSQISDLCKGSTRAFLNQEILSSIIFPLAPLAEQRLIVDEVERCQSQIDKLEDDLSYDLARADRLRQSILKRAFEGKLVPQDPNDEPASVLLERIRAERARKTPGLRNHSRGRRTKDVKQSQLS